MSLNNFDNNYRSQQAGPVTKLIISMGLASTPQGAEKLMIPISIVLFLAAGFFVYKTLGNSEPPPPIPAMTEEASGV